MSTIRPDGKAQPEFCVAVRKKKLGSALLSTPELFTGSASAAFDGKPRPPLNVARSTGLAQGGRRVVAAAGLPG
jgi:hypothetical protein